MVMQIPTNEAGIVVQCKAKWHKAMEEVAYLVLDLTKENWQQQSVKDKNLLHEELDMQFAFDPRLILMKYKGI